MYIIFELIIFFIVLFIYLKINDEINVTRNYEIYNIKVPGKETLELDISKKNPIFFKFNSRLLKYCNIDYIYNKYGQYNINVRKAEVNDEDELYVPIHIYSAIDKLDISGNKYYCENNSELLIETGMIKYFNSQDHYFRPPLCIGKEYDILIGSNNNTPLRYNIESRNILYVTDGEIKIKLIPPKFTKNLFSVSDYENYEFRSLIDPWKVKNEYINEYSKIKEFELTLKKGELIIIPMFWWHSVKFLQKSVVSIIRYKTLINYAINLHHTSMYYLQQLNIEKQLY